MTSLLEDLSNAQIKIIKKICFLQLNSLRRIYNNNPLSGDDITMLLIKEDIPREEFMELLEKRMDKFSEVVKDPNNIISLEDKDLSIFKHILAQIEDQYKSTYPNAISNLWSRLFMITDFAEFINNSYNNNPDEKNDN